MRRAIAEMLIRFGMVVAFEVWTVATLQPERHTTTGETHYNRREQSRFVKPQNRSRQRGLAIHHTSKGTGFAGLVG